MLPKKGGGAFPFQGRRPPPDSTAILTKAGGADMRHTKHRGWSVHERSRTLENENAHKGDRTFDTIRARDAGGDTRRRTPGREMPQDGVTTAERAATRAGDAHPPERDGDTIGGHPHGAEAPTPRRTSATQRSQEWAHRRVLARPDRGTPRLSGLSPSGRECAGGRGMRTQRGYSHPRTDARRGTSSQKGNIRQRGHTHWADKGGHTPAHRHPDPRRHTTGTTTSDAGRRAHTHTHHTPTEGVWRAPLPGHLCCSATR